MGRHHRKAWHETVDLDALTARLDELEADDGDCLSLAERSELMAARALWAFITYHYSRGRN